MKILANAFAGAFLVSAAAPSPAAIDDLTTQRAHFDAASTALSAPNDAIFVDWARHVAMPLSTGSNQPGLHALGQMIGEAKIVALSEGVHTAAEPLQFRNQVLEYLVTEKGFTAIAIESGLVEGRVVNEYVRGSAGRLDAALFYGITWTFDKLPQNRELVQWLRDYNADRKHLKKVNFYGFDMSGSPGNPNPNRATNTAVVEALRFVDRVDRDAGKAFHLRLDPLLQNIRFDFTHSDDAPGYEDLKQPQRDAITAAIEDLISVLERKEASYSAATSADDYEWAYQAALSARQTDAWLRQIPLRWRPEIPGAIDYHAENNRFLAVAQDVRDRAQADNIGWIVRREGPAGKILVFAHRYHVSAAALRTRWSTARGAEQVEQEPAGSYLRQRFGDRLVTIGNLVGHGDIACSGYSDHLDPTPQSLDGIAGQVGRSGFLLDLRTAPSSVAAWLNRPVSLGQRDDAFTLAPGRAFDLLTYFGTISPACPG